MLIRHLDPAADADLLPGLAAVLLEAVAGGASIGFMAGFSAQEALAWWQGRLAAAARGEMTILIAVVDYGVAGTVSLVLDTISGSVAARLYERCGWVKVGDIPAYALMPDGEMAPTTVYTKRLT